MVMKGLSVEAVNYIRAKEEGKSKLRGVDVASHSQVEEELKNILRQVFHEAVLDTKSISFKSGFMTEERLTVKATICLCNVPDLLVEVVLSPSKGSTFKITYQGSKSLTENSFFTSPAYKRYFEPYSTNHEALTTHISTKLITSRYLGDYMTHILNCAEGYVHYIRQISASQKLAA